LLIEKRADVNIVDKHGQTALSLACDNNFTDIIPTLLREGADPFAGAGQFSIPKSCAGIMSLYLARSGRCTACGKYLPLLLHSPSSRLSTLHSPSY
jgi:ankyrin repeat protein